MTAKLKISKEHHNIKESESTLVLERVDVNRPTQQVDRKMKINIIQQYKSKTCGVGER